jgi:Tfp pilus assembly protein FimT
MLLVAIVLAAATPSFQSVGRRLAVLGATHEVMTALHATRSASIARGRPGTLCLTTRTLVCVAPGTERGVGFRTWIKRASGAASRFEPSDALLATVPLSDDIEIRGSRAAVTFWPTARSGTTNTLTICDRRGISPPEQVVISQSGRPRLARASAAACR